MKDNLKSRFIEFSLRKQLFEENDNVLVAVSGGVDSMVLLHLLNSWRRRLKINLGIIHLHHGIRGPAAEADYRFVKETADSLTLPFYFIRRSIPEYAEEHRLSLEEAGHQIRESEFEKLASEKGYQKIATAHHMDDQAETILMRLLSGSGIQGLAGIRLRKGKWVRPLLFAARSEIENYAANNSIEFRTDATNEDVSILRNKIRHELLPVLKTGYDAQAVQHLAQISSVLEEWDAYLNDTLDEIEKDDVLRISKNKISLEIPGFKLYFSWIKIRLIERVLSMLSGEPEKVAYNKFTDFLHWLDQGRIGSRFSWSSSIESAKQKDLVIFYRTEYDSGTGNSVEIYPGAWYQTPAGGIKLNVSEVDWDEVQFHSDKSEEFINGTELQFPLFVRQWQPGDRFRPLGSQHSRLVSDYLTDMKIGQPEKSRICVLLNKNEIVAIVGVQINDRYKVQKRENKIYRLILATEG